MLPLNTTSNEVWWFSGIGNIELPVPLSKILYIVEKLALTEFIVEPEQATPLRYSVSAVTFKLALLLDTTVGALPPFIILIIVLKDELTFDKIGPSALVIGTWTAISLTWIESAVFDLNA